MRAVLTFHHLGDDPGPLAFPARSFEALLRSLGACRLPVVDLDRLLAPGAGPGVAIAFDDGWRSVLTEALPVLRSTGTPAHLFLCTGMLAREGPERVPMPAFPRLDWRDVEAVHRDGVRIESHTHAHPDLRGLTEARVAEECGRADTLIERCLGRRPRYFAYPYGRHDAGARRVAGSKYAAAFTTRLATLGDADDRSALPRLDAHYLRNPVLQRRLDGRAARGWLALRRFLRTMRGER
jgi:peptidoglycan/xylan/chitin deacetylase (PgdA/CDA1 family)